MLLRYVGDTYTLVPTTRLQSLLDYMNSVKISIQFTLEKQSEDQLTFLDVLIIHTDLWNLPQHN